MVAGSGMVLDDQTPFFNWRHETERIPGFEIVPAPGRWRWPRPVVRCCSRLRCASAFALRYGATSRRDKPVPCRK
jgi:hypothetical protein